MKYNTRQFVLSLSILALAGCSSSQSFVDNMNAYNGQSASKLIADFGTPDQRIEKDGQTILMFRPLSMNIPIPMTDNISQSGGTYVSPRSNTNYQIKANCHVAFTIKNDQVNDWSSQGKDCPKPKP